MPADQSTRLRALDPECSFIVQAPAGSGKTEVLTQRFLRLLATVDKPERVVAITFTRKATQEMRTRINDRLAEANAGIRPDSEHDRRAVELASAVLRRSAEQKWNLVENPGRLRITTIDGLCVQLLSRDPVHGPLWSGVRVLEDARPLYREAIRRMFADIDELADGAAGDDNTTRFAQQALVRVLVELGGDSRRLEADLMDMLRRRSLWERHLDTGHESLDELLVLRQQKALADLENALGARELDEAMTVAEALGCDFNRGTNGLENQLRSYYQFVRLLGTGTFVPYKPGSLNRGRFPDMGDGHESELHRLKEIFQQWHDNNLALDAWKRFAAAPPLDPEHRHESGKNTLLDDIRCLLSLALYEFKTVCAERGESDFTAISDAAVKSLGSESAPGDALLAEDERIDHVLMDEFQDTSYTQFELMKGLTAGWQPGDGRTLFLVGDPMQSIYRFREANVGFFNEVVSGGQFGNISLKALSLTSNFRSRRELIEWYNETFSGVFPRRDESDSGAVSYTAVDAERGEGGHVGLHAFGVNDSEANQFRTIVELIRNRLEKCPSESIAILARARNMIPDLTAELTRSGIVYEAVDMQALNRRPVVMELQILTRALLHPLDRIAWIALLRAPWCGLKIAEIHKVLGDEHDESILVRMSERVHSSQAGSHSNPRLERLFEVMHYARQLAPFQPLSRLVEMCWIQLGGPLCCEDTTDIEDAQDYLDLLQEVERAGFDDVMAALEEAMEDRYAASRPAPVKVMTIHKAKGLQFDTVIVPDIARRTGSNSRPLVELQEFTLTSGRSGVLLAPRTPRYISEISLHHYLGKVDEERSLYESMRLLYVACTRARNELHLLADVKLKKDGSPSIPAGSFLALLTGVFSKALASVEPGESESRSQQKKGAIEPEVLPLVRLDCDLPPLAFKDDVITQNDDALSDLPRREAAALGTVLHEWLELVHDCRLEDWSMDRIEKSASTIRSGLKRAGAPSEAIERLENRCLTILYKVLFEQGWLTAIRSGLGTESWSELPLYLREGNRLSSHIIDLLVRTATGGFEIIDYKTRPSTEASAEKWQSQLDRYRALIEKLGHGPVDHARIFTLEEGQ